MTDTPTVLVAPASGHSTDTPSVHLSINLPRGGISGYRQSMTEEVQSALRAANRSCGWNFRELPVRRFRLGGCELFVVPARRWAFRHETQAGKRAAP
jgi:hypothetical protein